MEFRDYTVVIIGIVLLVAGVITGGAVFYLAASILLLFIGADFYQLRSSLSDIKRQLEYRTELHGTEWHLGSDVKVSTTVKYRGKKKYGVRASWRVDSSIKVLEPLPDELVLSPGTSFRLVMELRPQKTGEVTIGPLVLARESRFFRDSIQIGGTGRITVSAGLGYVHVLTNPSSIRVKKNTDFLSSDLVETRRGTDFYKVRPYAAGDELKNVDWARSSRTGALIVKEYEESRALPVFFLIDADVSMAIGDEMSELDTAISLTVKLANKLLMDNTMFGLASFSRADIVTFRPLGMGRDHAASLKALLSGMKPANETDYGHLIPMPVYEADSISRILRGTEGLELMGSVMTETLKEHVMNVRTDGFIRAITKASQSTSVPCQMVVMTNLSMGIASLMNGIRIAGYYGHSASVVLTPHIWYQDKEQIDAEQFYERYQEVKHYISRIRSIRNVKVVDLYSGDKVDEIIYKNVTYGLNTGIRR